MPVVSRLAGVSVLVAALLACSGAAGPVAAAESAVVSRGVVTLSPRATGPTFEVSVADADPNVDPTQPDAVHVYARNASSQLVRHSLEETGPDTGVFAGSVAVPAGTAHDGTITVTYRDSNAEAATCGPAVVSATTVFNTDADLSLALDVTNADGTKNFLPGAQVVVTATVRNDGGSSWAAGPSRLMAYFVGPGEYAGEVDARPITTYPGVPVGTLAPGASQTLVLPYTIPAGMPRPWSVSAGVYILDDTQEEFSGSNNSASVPL